MPNCIKGGTAIHFSSSHKVSFSSKGVACGGTVTLYIKHCITEVLKKLFLPIHQHHCTVILLLETF